MWLDEAKSIKHLLNIIVKKMMMKGDVLKDRCAVTNRMEVIWSNSMLIGLVNTVF